MSNIASIPRKRLHRISSAEFSMTESVLEMACILGIPVDPRQRQEFEEMMQVAYVLRKNGHSWQQLQKHLTESGFKGQFAKVRTYYDAMLQAAQKCPQEPVMRIDTAELAEIRGANIGAEFSAIAGLTAAMLSHKKIACGNAN